MTDEVHYVLPFGILGRVVHALFVKRQLEMIFGFRESTLEKMFPDTAAPRHSAIATGPTYRGTTYTSRRKKAS
jgi:hypothetical protein